MGRGALLLIVDDDGPGREALRELLEVEGYEVATAANGAEGLARMLQAPHPELAIIDLMMPVMDGWVLVSRLRAEPQFARLPVILVTAFGGGALASAPKATALLPKPVRAERLLEEVRRALDGPVSRSTGARAPEPSTPPPSTPIRLSGPYPLLQQAAEETARDLHALATSDASALAAELLGIAAEIRRWRPDNSPKDEHRARVTDELIFRIRRAFDLLGRSGLGE